MEEVAVWLVGGMIVAIAVAVAAIGAYERRQHRRVEALGRRRKERIQL